MLAGLGGLGALALPLSALASATRLTADKPTMSLGSGRSLIEIEVPARAFVSIAVTGPREALLGFALLGDAAAPVRARGPLEEDGLLPRVVSFRSQDDVSVIMALVDVVDPVEVALVWATDADDREPTPKGLKDGVEAARPLVGFPAPATDRHGYGLAAPGRYLFARIDVVRSLMTAFEKTRKRFKSDPIYVGDASQWDGRRPKSDLSQPRHISHDG
ncbi:MAG: hypothetical protein HOV80_39505, partial [Polyangiaceae bacterium]|nr:hypothetical protein [Polyangiaceae bacterium]